MEKVDSMENSEYRPIPEKVKEAAELIDSFGSGLIFYGIYKNKEAYVFSMPSNLLVGFPKVLLYSPEKETVELIRGPESLRVLKSLNNSNKE